ncbi:hypothetical protein R3P38DRAFT_2800009 [Favolaschia claudopus]|uniref:Uncharacterized protein n=1 Tax=Favolaschia claudopus TaxID=2862362 RepID=A0AAV9ZYH6_9AGAR
MPPNNSATLILLICRYSGIQIIFNTLSATPANKPKVAWEAEIGRVDRVKRDVMGQNLFGDMAPVSRQSRHLAKARAKKAASDRENHPPSSPTTHPPRSPRKAASSPRKSKKKLETVDLNYVAELKKENILLRRREKRHKEQIAELKRKVAASDASVAAATAEMQAASAAARKSAERAIHDLLKNDTELESKLAKAEQKLADHEKLSSDMPALKSSQRFASHSAL